MRPSVIAFQALTMMSSCLSLAIPTPANDFSGPGIDIHSLNVPVRPSRDLSNTIVTITELTITATFEPPHLFYNIYYFLVTQWSLGFNMRITTPRRFSTGYPGGGQISTVILPTAASLPFNFNTIIVAAVLERMLEYMSTHDLQPRLLKASLSTPANPSRVVGAIRNEYTPPRRPGGMTPALADDDEMVEVVANSTANDGIDVRVRFRGQSSVYPLITQKIWLASLTGFTAQVLAQARSTDDLVARRPYLTYVQARTSSYILQVNVRVMDVPWGKQPMKMEGFMHAMTIMLVDVVLARRYEIVRVEVVDEDWVAAVYELGYVAVNQGVESA